ncbi:MAG: hypothetical protein M0T84_17905 [Betaproteobacteria bacterium]|nr:hypothetical protein [Betaproteobacteria bacterium]
MVRLYEADRAFPPDRFAGATQPSSTKKETQYRITGRHGLGHGLSIEYDLRAGSVQTIHDKHNKPIGSRSTGLEDQVVGLNFGLRQSRHFADSVTFNIVFPTGSSTRVPALGTGHWAVEPDYQLGIAHGPVTATLLTGPRVFPDGGATQLRAMLWVGAAVSPRIRVAGTVFYVRTVAGRSPVPATDQAERYNLLRLGAGIGYKVRRNVKPFLIYEVNAAGKNIHAGHRFTLGISFRY